MSAGDCTKYGILPPSLDGDRNKRLYVYIKLYIYIYIYICIYVCYFLYGHFSKIWSLLFGGPCSKKIRLLLFRAAKKGTEVRELTILLYNSKIVLLYAGGI